MDEVDPSSGESLPRAFETNFFLETGRLVSNTVSQFLSLLFHVHLFWRGYFLPFFSFFLLLDFFKRYIISFFLRSFFYVLLFHVLLSIIFASLRVALRETMFSFFLFLCVNNGIDGISEMATYHSSNTNFFYFSFLS